MPPQEADKEQQQAVANDSPSSSSSSSSNASASPRPVAAAAAAKQGEDAAATTTVYAKGTRIRKMFPHPDTGVSTAHDGTVIGFEKGLPVSDHDDNDENDDKDNNDTTADYYLVQFDNGDKEHIRKTKLEQLLVVEEEEVPAALEQAQHQPPQEEQQDVQVEEEELPQQEQVDDKNNDNDNDANNVYPQGTRIRKLFDDPNGSAAFYDGTVIKLDRDLFNEETGETSDYYFVRFVDGDEEHIAGSELQLYVDNFTKDVTLDDIHVVEEEPNKKKKAAARKKRATKKKKAAAPAPAGAAAKKRRKQQQQPPPKRSDDEDDDDMMEVDAPPQKNKRSAARAKQVDDDDDSDDSENLDKKPRAKKSRRSQQGSNEEPEAKQVVRATTRRGRSVKKVYYGDDDDDDDDNPSSDSESEADDDDESESESDLDSDVVVEEEDDDELLVEDEEERPAKKKNKKKQPAAAAAAAAAKNKPKGKKLCESFSPINNPVYYKLSQKEIDETKQYLDPCGMEATDDIIDKKIGEQVEAIGGLMQRAFRSGNVGSAADPLRLGTACSGTDAPALAMTLVQEQLELRGIKAPTGAAAKRNSPNTKKNNSQEEDDPSFHFEHQFSCESEPFKQAYLARNFDSDLYPDITKLVNEEVDEYVPCDVYGQSRPLSEFNMFVAGTSCKNFSMLRSKFRIDIEDKGCSGETFLAACQVLFEHQPDCALFENVLLAPWEKMAEYITGRIKLSNCSDTKSIKENKTKDRELEFVRDGNRIVVDFVPAVYGVRCGAVVRGYVTGDSTEVHAVSWPSKTKTTSKCLLAELMKHNGISKANDTLVFETECTYCTRYINVDTKEFGLPQTRNRVYMFVWKPHNNNVNDDLGDYWAAIVNQLKSPCRHSLDAFLLSEDHDIVRVFREALNGPPGRQSKHDCFTEPYFWTSASANVAHCSNPRKALSLGQEARWLTNWHAFGKKHIPPSFWLEYANMLSQRKCDMLDTLNASAIRDSQSKDPLWSPYCWNLSQNSSKEKHTGAVPAIASCLSPGGEVFLPHKGRPLLGVEKLIIQGLPYFRLLLGSESEVQLGDLAGNAMSSTVVSATMLAAMTCRQLREETISQCKSKDPKKLAATRDKILKSHCGLETDRTVAVADIDRMRVQDDMSDALGLFSQLASLAETAVQTSVWCTCETSGKNSSSESFLQCRDCHMSCCRNCVSEQAGINLATHTPEEVVVDSKDHAVGAFQTRLRNLLPPSLVISDEGWKELSALDGDRFRVKPLAGSQFHLHRIKRDRKRWIILYYTRDNVCGECVAELRLVVGAIERRTPTDLGLRVEFKSFQPARTEPRVYGPLEPCAKLVLLTGCSERTESWKGKSSSKQIPVYVKGSGSTDSLRVEVGLEDNVADVIREAANGKKYFNEAKKLGEERRWLYPNNWKAWPETITLTAECDFELDFSGDFCRSPCRQTANHSAIWIRKATETSRPLYILIQPEASRTGPDIAVISRSLDHGDLSAIVAAFPRSWQPCDALSPTGQIETFTIFQWTDLSKMACKVPKAKLTVSGGDPESDTLVSINGLSKSQVEMLARNSSPELNSISLNVHSGQNAQQLVRAFNAVCVATLLQFVTSSEFQYDLTPNASWRELSTSSEEVAFGHCEASVPVRPVEKWFFDGVRKAWERRSRPEEARQYYLKLEKAPRAFEFLLNRASQTLDVKYNPRVVAHQAAAKLIRNRGQEIEKGTLLAQFRLADVSLQSDPVITPFSVPNCNKEAATNISLKGSYKLYERQQKVVTAMLNIEAGKKEFEELEISESAMPGSSGLTLIAKASRKMTIRGGVIADAIGSGKTVISIAIILAGLEKARASCSVPRKSGATLVLVPPALIKQWEDEIEKFAEGLNVVTIFDQPSLESQTLQELRDKTDVVICNIDILTSSGSKNPHLVHLLTCAKMVDPDVDVPTLPHFAPQKEVSAARGTWVPHTSQDPYAGANNPLSQRRRNQSAYHTHIYHQAITEVRKLTLGDNDSVPLEYLEWERIIVDEVHETLCTTKSELDLSKAKAANDKNNATGFYEEKNRRAGRELLGITQRDVNRRPLTCRGAMFGLTGTPLLDSSDRVTELASMIGSLYVTGLSAHWRKLERESCRDIFLHNYLEPKPSRETRSTIHSQCQAFLDVCCCRNRVAEAEMDGIQLKTRTNVVQMSRDEEGLYLQSQAGIPTSKRSLGIKPEDFDVSAGHDVYPFLRQNAKLPSRGRELVNIVTGILEKDPTTKIIVFADGGIGAGIAARDFLQSAGLGCTWIDPQEDSVQSMNKKIGWYQRGDATEEDRQRPRVLVLHFEHAAGLNLQQECYNLILFTPLYKGVGGASSDAVADTSTELQAIGRVMRIGQLRPEVNVFRIECRGPDGQECLDGQLIRRNTDEETIAMAVNAGDDEKPSQ